MVMVVAISRKLRDIMIITWRYMIRVLKINLYGIDIGIHSTVQYTQHTEGNIRDDCYVTPTLPD